MGTYEINVDKILNKEFLLLFDINEIICYNQEIVDAKILLNIINNINSFKSTVKGTNVNNFFYSFGNSKISLYLGLYYLIRKFKPKVLVETGVCNGVSTYFILLAIKKNKFGNLVSIDYPEIVGSKYEMNDFWNGKGGAAVYPNKEPGWIIPNDLVENWSLKIGKSENILPDLLMDLKYIDFFLHDSEHSFKNMMFEMTLSYEHLTKNGILVVDDIHSNKSYNNFIKDKSIVSNYELSKVCGLIIKDSL